MARSININCDMGEIQDSWDSGRDKALLGHVDAVNVCCGEHAGNHLLIEETIKYAIELGLQIGAHPSYPDRENFGRNVIRISIEELKDLLKEQVSYIKNLVEKHGGKLHHVKPHGALYNEAALNLEVAALVADVTKEIDDNLILFGLAQSKGVAKYKELGLKVWQEVFADRTYERDGSLRNRKLEGALILEPRKAFEQVNTVLERSELVSYSGEIIEISGDSFCIHGDAENALEIAQFIKGEL
ncbi:5-oxoprolinase subunit PxpA [Arcticibacterium luteifluviistationis]|uniref:LamB/YcsF family protein n=1 Tax=Arcticibacterium luteifluviistationis TaxID=1784714 RepID=A0A2Z4GHE0_9BACT|nr:5-oxoprolinase subunit PxpA [Arcticibacterium luteifluviistationis]AWW00488.1 LamB/YcsF family protein [Arcticibacterium luteifluviistationis]